MTNELIPVGVTNDLTAESALSMNTSDLNAYIRSVEEAPLLTREEETELGQRLQQDGDLDAARQLIMSQLRYVVRIARGFNGYGLPLADLIQEGNIGLMKAVKRYDPERGVRLVSFAVHWIKAEIYEYVLANWRIVKVATTKSQRKLFFNLRKAKATIGWLQNDEVADLSNDLNVSEDDVRKMESRLTGRDIAFNTENDDDEEGQYAPESWLSDDTFRPDLIVEAHDTKANEANALATALGQLDDRSREIISRRWLNEDNKSTLTELAEEYNVSAERIRQIEAKAMATMKEALI